jgi:hypothetical protein
MFGVLVWIRPALQALRLRSQITAFNFHRTNRDPDPTVFLAQSCSNRLGHPTHRVFTAPQQE